MKTVTVNAEALRQVLQAATGPSHLIRELHVIHDLATKLEGNTFDPLGVLVREYNAAVQTHALIEKAKQDDNS